MTDQDTDRSARLADELAESGDLSPEWRGAFLRVPRHAYIPDVIWVGRPGGGLGPLWRSEDPRAWQDACYADAWVATQVDDGLPAEPGAVGRVITSSASRPSVVALMLRELRAEPGMDVLEIGTGTGYNAALLAARLGDGHVTSVEVDPGVAAEARAALLAEGLRPHLVCADGMRGYEPGAPYDRIIVTAAVHDVPYAWVEQTRPGGLVLTPWATHFHNGALLALRPRRDGTAVGRFAGNVAFMWVRCQRPPRVSVEDDAYDADGADVSATDLHPYDVMGTYAASLAIGIRVPECAHIVVPGKAGGYTVWLIDGATRSWASLTYTPGEAAWPVRQLGPRRLWDEVAAAHTWWRAKGEPPPEAWRITVTPEGQKVELAQ